MLDGMIVREITRRCSFDPAQVAQVQQALALPYRETRLGGNNRAQDRLLIQLRDHYRASGYLSARILDCIDDLNTGLIDPEPIMDLIDSLPKKPFKVISIHQWWI